MTTTQPQWRYVPFVSTLLMCSGLFMLLHGASPQPARPPAGGTACEGVSAPTTLHSVSRTPTGEAQNSPDDRGDAAKASAAASTHDPADIDLFDDLIFANAKPWSPLRSNAFWLRGPPSSDDAGVTHRVGTGPLDSSFDATDDDDDDGDDETDTDDGDGVAALVTASTDASCVVHTSSLLSRVEVHHPVSFASDVQSLRAPPQ